MGARGPRRPLRLVPAHPDLTLKLGYQESCAGALPGAGFVHDWTRDPDFNVERVLERLTTCDSDRSSCTTVRALLNGQVAHSAGRQPNRSIARNN